MRAEAACRHRRSDRALHSRRNGWTTQSRSTRTKKGFIEYTSTRLPCVRPHTRLAGLTTPCLVWGTNTHPRAHATQSAEVRCSFALARCKCRHGVETRCKCYSQCGRCTSVRPVGHRKWQRYCFCRQADPISPGSFRPLQDLLRSSY